MGDVVSFSLYANKYLIYKKTFYLKKKKYNTIIEINKKLIKPYDAVLVIKRHHPLDFDLIDLGDFLIQNQIWFKLYLPLKNTKGFYIKHFPTTQNYLDHYAVDDDFSFLEKRPAEHYEFIDIFNDQITGIFGKISF